MPPDVDERKGEDFSHEIFIFICYCPPKLHNFFQNYFACPPGHFVVLTHRIMSIQDIKTYHVHFVFDQLLFDDS